jgi:hypothetical protein
MISTLVARSQASSVISWVSQLNISHTNPATHEEIVTTPGVSNPSQTKGIHNYIHMESKQIENIQPLRNSNTGRPPNPTLVQLSNHTHLTIDHQEQYPTDITIPANTFPNTTKNPYKNKVERNTQHQNGAPVKSPLHQLIKWLDSSHQQHITATKSTTTLALLQGLPNIPISNKKPSPTNSLPTKKNAPRQRKTTLAYHSFSMAPKYIQSDETWGHSPEIIDTTSIFRVLLQNPRGLKFSEGDDLAQFSFIEARNLGVGTLCLPETNTNWTLLSSQSQLARITRPIWKNSSTQTSHINENFESIYQPGGTLTMICENWASRIVEKGSDPFGLGRWSYFILQRKGDIRIAIVTAYQVCSASLSSLGPTTYTMQQYRKLSSTFRSENKTTQPNPRHQFILSYKHG